MKPSTSILFSIVLQACNVGGLHPVSASITAFTDTPTSVRIADSSDPSGYINIDISVTCAGSDYDGLDGKVGCNGEKYGYSKFTTVPAWPQTVGGVSYTAADNQRYWDWVYDGYDGGGACDYSQNCHGYAFGVGDWPSGSGGIMVAPPVNCWITDANNATIADSGGHSVKITMQDCQNSLGIIVKTSSEKFRESGIYTQTGNCSLVTIPIVGAVNLGKGNDPRAGLTFELYKKN